MNKYFLLGGAILLGLGLFIPIGLGQPIFGATTTAPYLSVVHFLAPGAVPLPGVLVTWIPSDGSTANCLNIPNAPTNFVLTDSSGNASCYVTTTNLSYTLLYNPPSPYVGGTFTFTPSSPNQFTSVTLSQSVTTTSSTTTSTSASSVPVTSTTIAFVNNGATPIPGVVAQLNQVINGVTTTISSGTSDSGGHITFSGFSVPAGTQLSVSNLPTTYQGVTYAARGYIFTLNSVNQFNPDYLSVETATTSTTSTTGPTTSTTQTTTTSSAPCMGAACKTSTGLGITVYELIDIVGATLLIFGLVLPEFRFAG